MRLAIISVFLLASSVAHAGKQSVAILGLEPVDAKDTAAATAAKNLTDGLRARVKAGDGPYVLAPGADLDLAKLKKDKKCEAEAAPCMAAIGTELNADQLIYGRLEKTKDGYQVTIKIMTIAKKAVARTASEAVVAKDAEGAAAQARAKAIYAKLTGS